MKKCKKILTFIVGLMLILTSFTTSAYASDANSAALDARNGVVKVLVYYNDHDYPSAMGTGFLINKDTIITAAHVVADEPEMVVTKVTVVAVADIEIEASLRKASSARDFAVLDLNSPINERQILTLGLPEGFDATSEVFALGFPQISELLSSSINYSPDDVVVTGGTVSSLSPRDSVDYIQHSAKLDSGNSGGPLVAVDSAGNATVVGVNVSSVSTSEATFYYSINIEEVTEALNTLGIEYTSYGAPVTDGSTDKSADKTADETADETGEEPEAKGVLGGIADNKVTTVAIVIAVVIIVLIVILIIIYANEKKKQRAMPSPSFGSGAHSAYQPQNTAASPTGNNRHPGAISTTLLQEAHGGVCLYKPSSNERIPITVSQFKVGKDPTRVDYCITGNSAVSRLHAIIKNKGGKFFIEDQNSTNFTYVNGLKLTPNSELELKNGAKIKLADEEFIFEQG